MSAAEIRFRLPEELADVVSDLIAARASCTTRWGAGWLTVAFMEAPPVSLLDALGTWLFNLGVTDLACEGLETIVTRTPVQAGLEIRPPWLSAAADVSIIMAPSVAFGTGTHPTTLLMLRAMTPLIEPGERVLDIGAGSGVLSIYAALLGARVVGEEIDGSALAAARINGAANQVDVAWTGASIDALDGQFDLVLANIFAGVLFGFAEAIAARAARDLLLSGLLESEEDAALAKYPGFARVGRATHDGWLMLHLRRLSA